MSGVELDAAPEALAALEALADDLPALLEAMAGPADVAALEAMGDGLPALLTDLGSIW